MSNESILLNDFKFNSSNLKLTLIGPHLLQNSIPKLRDRKTTQLLTCRLSELKTHTIFPVQRHDPFVRYKAISIECVSILKMLHRGLGIRGVEITEVKLRRKTIIDVEFE
jgi:hypothetical protein